MPKRRRTTKCTNQLYPGRFQAVFVRHIMRAKSEHDLDFLAWMETLGCPLKPPSENLGL